MRICVIALINSLALFNSVLVGLIVTLHADLKVVIFVDLDQSISDISPDS